MRSHLIPLSLGATRSPAAVVVRGLTLAAVVAVGLLCGLLAASVDVRTLAVALLVTAALIATALLVRRFGLGVAVGALISLTVGAFPALSNRTMLAAGIEVTDVGVAGLIGVLVIASARQQWVGFRNVHVRRLTIACALLVAWWTVTMLRTTLGPDPGPVLQAVRYGRDFAYFAVLLPLAAAAFTDARLRNAALATVGVIATGTALMESALALGMSPLATLVRPNNSFVLSGITRIYTDASDLVLVAFFFALAHAVASPAPRIRRFSAVVAAICLLDIGLALGRAKYLGVAVSVLLVALLWARVNDSGKRTGILTLSVVGLIAILLIIAPTTRPATALMGASDRLVSTLSDVSGGNSGPANTFLYRLDVQRTMRQRLSQENAWLPGLGFRSASFDYDPNLPGGNIRNSDVGYYGGLMTMGLVGLLLLALPMLYAAAALVRTRWAPNLDAANVPIAWAVLAVCIYALVTSGSLVLMFTSSGIAVTALAVGIGVAILPVRRANHQTSTE